MPATLSQHPFETVPTSLLDDLRAALKTCREAAVRHAEACLTLPNFGRRHLSWIAQMVDCREACKACEQLLAVQGEIALEELRDRLAACAEICDACFRESQEQAFDHDGECAVRQHDCAGRCRHLLVLLSAA